VNPGAAQLRVPFLELGESLNGEIVFGNGWFFGQKERAPG